MNSGGTTSASTSVTWTTFRAWTAWTRRTAAWSGCQNSVSSTHSDLSRRSSTTWSLASSSGRMKRPWARTFLCQSKVDIIKIRIESILSNTIIFTFNIAMLFSGKTNSILMTREYYQEYSCRFNLLYYPFDTQVGEMKFNMLYREGILSKE